MEEIIKPFEKSLFDNNIRDIGIDMIEVGIDSFLQEGPIKDIPIVGNIVKAGQFVYNIYDRNLLRQTLVFIQQFNNNKVDSDKLNDYRETLKKDFKKAEKELGRVLIILNKMIDSEKSTILAKLYSAYINQDITWEDFCELSEANDRLFVKDITVLYNLYDLEGIVINEEYDYIYKRLISIGLLKDDVRLSQNAIVAVPIDGRSYGPKRMKLTRLGNIFCKLCR